VSSALPRSTEDDQQELLVRICSDVVVTNRKARLMLRVPFALRVARNDDYKVVSPDTGAHDQT
jgi:hypothetical protein